jgi:ribosomal protein S27E
MPIKLVKTTGGNNGAPQSCKGCGANHFVKSGISWSCSICGVYILADLGTKSTLMDDFLKLKELHRDFKRAIDTLEKLTQK